MSRRSQAKQARRQKRRAVQNSSWIPDTVFEGLSDDIALAAVLESLDEQLTGRGWVFDDEASDDETALWWFPASEADVPADIVPATSIVMTADDDGEIVHVVFVGSTDDYQFALEELVENLEKIEEFRVGNPVPEFDS